MKSEIEKEPERLSLVDVDKKKVSGRQKTRRAEPVKWTNMVIKQALSMAKKIDADAILVYIDSTKDLGPFSKIKSGIKIILLTKRMDCLEMASAFPVYPVLIPDVQLTRTGYLKIGFLAAMSKGLLESGDVIVCVGGVPEQGFMDTIMLVEVDLESELFGSAGDVTFPPRMRSEVFETLLDFVLQLANEGREGKPVGAIFVLGDHEKVLELSHQLVFNPFKGHPEEALNITEPKVLESLKEFSSVDGAFIIRDDGVTLAAGRYLNVVYHGEPLPQGLGARHAAAAAITQVTESLALTISESTGKVTVFRAGKILTEIEKVSPQVNGRPVLV